MHVYVDLEKIPSDLLEGQFGGGGQPYLNALTYQRGFGPYQRGKGFGSALKAIWRLIGPAVRTFGKDLGGEALKATSSTLADYATTDIPFKELIKSNALKGSKQLLKKTSDRVNQIGSGKRKAPCIRRPQKKPRTKELMPKPRTRDDILRYYK